MLARWRVPGLSVILFFIPALASAATIQIVATGFTRNTPAVAAVAATLGIPDGTRWSFNGFIDDGVADQNPLPNNGEYSGLSGMVTLGMQTFSVSEFAVDTVSVRNAGNFAGWDGIAVELRSSFESAPLLSSGDRLVYFGFSVQNIYRPDLTNSEALSELLSVDFADAITCPSTSPLGPCSEPISPPPALAFNIFTPGKGTLPLNGLVDSYSAVVVPIPAAAWLFASALGGLASLRRR